MAASVTEILEAHKGGGVRGNGLVWRVEGTSARIEQCKIELLEAVCRDAQPFVHYEESPAAVSGLSGAVEQHGAWQLPLGVSGSVLLDWLYLGNWQLYVRAEPLSRLPDLSRSTDAEVESFLVESGASVIIDSFHDDVSWVVGVNK